MKPTNSAPGATGDGKPSGSATGSGSTKTPNADMQAEDAGSVDSGGADSGSTSAGDESADDSATAATRAMKQTSKTAVESGGKR